MSNETPNIYAELDEAEKVDPGAFKRWKDAQKSTDYSTTARATAERDRQDSNEGFWLDVNPSDASIFPPETEQPSQSGESSELERIEG